VKILWTQTALDQLEEVPRRPAEQILAKLEAASRHPEMYPVRQRGRHRGIRWFPAGAWLVFYEVSEDALVVRGILYGAMREA
jgi:plasmid stabilization system protein ParE